MCAKKLFGVNSIIIFLLGNHAMQSTFACYASFRYGNGFPGLTFLRVMAEADDRSLFLFTFTFYFLLHFLYFCQS